MSKKFIFLVILVVIVTGGSYLYFTFRRGSARTMQVFNWFRDPASHPDLMMAAGTRCGNAPFIFPTNGLAGFIWDDSFRPGHRHQGIDIFAGTDVGVTPVYAAYPGYLTRKADWKSSVIIRVPSDPLEPSRQIWVYYTHMADPGGNSFISEEFPAGTSEHSWRQAHCLAIREIIPATRTILLECICISPLSRMTVLESSRTNLSSKILMTPRPFSVCL